MTLQALLNRNSNNYQTIADHCQKRFGFDIVTGQSQKDFTITGSIVIPYLETGTGLRLRKTLLSLLNQNIDTRYSKSNIEIILINDGSTFDSQHLDRLLQKLSSRYHLTHITLKDNVGRATARNIGLREAKNEVVIFLDSDIICQPNFLKSHLLRHELSNNLALVGFQQRIRLSDGRISLNNIQQGGVPHPDYKDDFRYQKLVPLSWHKTYTYLQDNEPTLYSPLTDSNYFREYGNGRLIGPWDLPFMFLTGNASVRRNNLISAGGFDPRYHGWGLEDTDLGARLIACGLYIIPVLAATTWHISGPTEGRRRSIEFKANFNRYQLRKKETFAAMTETAWRRIQAEDVRYLEKTEI